MKVLIIIDMLNGFCRRGFPLSLAQSTEGIENYIASRIESFLQKGDQVIFCCDSHTSDTPELKQYPPHCMKGTEEAEIIDSLKPYVKSSEIILKNTLSLFYETELDKTLSKIKPNMIEVVGVCTDICVLFAIFELRNRKFDVFVSHEGVLPLDANKQMEMLEYFRDSLGAEVEIPKL